ncbi:von Hippel-Lindau disease tumor suppressor-like [Saccostrea cucullata]|uniref:von Hippel-Lindau disease tumor suppressor-like n=1 Tax=Saccostrea cuccullata TaxID=36930 RepID=UPI002ED5B61F
MAGAPGGSMDQGVEVRKSKKSIVCSLVRFKNRTERGVDIIWLNYEGARVKYKTLQAYEFVDVNTYVGHPWIFLDVESGERLVVDLKSVYEPTTGWVPSQWPIKPVRKVVNITIPIYSLKDSCIRFFKKHLPKNNINKLDLPTSLLQEMYEKYDTPAIASGLRSTAKVIPPPDQEGMN